MRRGLSAGTAKWWRRTTPTIRQRWRLNTEKNKRRDAILEDIYRLIQEDVGHDLSRVKAQRLWAYAWELGHANGFPDVYCHLQDAIELARMLLE